MKNTTKAVFIRVVFIFLIGGSCYAADKSQSPGMEMHNKSIALRYIHDVLDGGQTGIMPELFTPNTQMHRPEVDISKLSVIQPIFSRALSTQKLKTTIHDIFTSGDRVFVRLSHKATFSSQKAMLPTRIGILNVTGKSINWKAMVILRFEKGKIAEEWVSRDELGMLLQVGKLKLRAE